MKWRRWCILPVRYIMARLNAQPFCNAGGRYCGRYLAVRFYPMPPADRRDCKILCGSPEKVRYNSPGSRKKCRITARAVWTKCGITGRGSRKSAGCQTEQGKQGDV